MWRLTRQVRFAVNAMPDGQGQFGVSNSHGGYPTLCGFGQYLELDVTLTGQLDPASSYLRNIKEIDQVVRDRGVPLASNMARAAFASGDGGGPADLTAALFAELRGVWGAALDQVALRLSPFLCIAARAAEFPMTLRLSQKFEFSASHRLFNASATDEQNYRTYGKCSNPNGHGHNYELQVTIADSPGEVGKRLATLPALERVVGEAVISRLDHKNLNLDVPEFAAVVPSVENIAQVIYRLLKPALAEQGAKLASVTVWETPKTWCEYHEP